MKQVTQNSTSIGSEIKLRNQGNIVVARFVVTPDMLCKLPSDKHINLKRMFILVLSSAEVVTEFVLSSEIAALTSENFWELSAKK